MTPTLPNPASSLFPPAYVAEPAELPGLKLVKLPPALQRPSEYAIVRFYVGASGDTVMLSIARHCDRSAAWRQMMVLRNRLTDHRSSCKRATLM